MGKKKDTEEKTSSHVFIVDPEYGWRPAIQLQVNANGTAIVTIPEYKSEDAMTCDGGRGGKKGEQVTINLKQYAHGVLPLQNVDTNGDLVEFADMVKLPYLHEVRRYK
jgi:hypothetical protein